MSFNLQNSRRESITYQLLLRKSHHRKLLLKKVLEAEAQISKNTSEVKRGKVIKVNVKMRFKWDLNEW